METIRSLAREHLVNEAVDEIIHCQREHALALYTAKRADKELEDKGIASCYLVTFINEAEGSFCPYEEDFFKDLPF